MHACCKRLLYSTKIKSAKTFLKAFPRKLSLEIYLHACYKVYTLYILAATGKFVFDADMDLLVNPKEEDLKFLDKVDQLFEGMGRLAYELPLFKIYKNNLYHFYLDALEVIFSKVHAKKCYYIQYLQGSYMNIVASMPTDYRRSWREVRAVKYRGCWSNG